MELAIRIFAVVLSCLLLGLAANFGLGVWFIDQFIKHFYGEEDFLLEKADPLPRVEIS